MAHAQRHAVQPFVREANNGIKPGVLRQCSSADGAKRLAERLVAECQAVGALAYSQPGAQSADEFAMPTFIARVSEVPETDDY